MSNAARDRGYRVFQFNPARDNRGEVCFWRDPQMHVHVGQPEVTIDEQGSSSGLGERPGDCSGEEGFPYPALTRSNGND